MSETEACHDCKNIQVYKNDENQCSECAQYVNKYYCEQCKIKHGCNKGFWESIAEKDGPPIEKLLRKFTKDILIEVDNIIGVLLKENDKLKEDIKKLKESSLSSPVGTVLAASAAGHLDLAKQLYS